jgi:hypothetical protein
MGNRIVLALVAIMAIAAVGGIGFATFTSAATVYGSGNSGNIAVAFDYGSTTGGTYAVCTITDLIGNTVHVDATDLSGGDSCSATLGVVNNGTLPVTSEATTFGYTSGSVCNTPTQMNCIEVSDNLGITRLNTAAGTSGSDNKVIAASGGLYPGNYVLIIGEPAGSNSAASLSFTITFTGSEGS